MSGLIIGTDNPSVFFVDGAVGVAGASAWRARAIVAWGPAPFSSVSRGAKALCDSLI
jgi:hypothetical protein